VNAQPVLHHGEPTPARRLTSMKVPLPALRSIVFGPKAVR
jgi:hypothetical protein